MIIRKSEVPRAIWLRILSNLTTNKEVMEKAEEICLVLKGAKIYDEHYKVIDLAVKNPDDVFKVYNSL